MITFERRLVTGADIEPSALSKLPADTLPKWQQITSLTTTSKHFDSIASAQALRKVVGDQITNLLLTLNYRDTIDIAAMILEDHVYLDDPNPKDLQLNLLANIVKEMAQNAEIPSLRRPSYAEDIIRRFQIDSDFKLALKKALFDQDIIHSAYLKINHWRGQ